MIKYMSLFFLICTSLSAVRDMPIRDSKTIIFEEHPPAKIMKPYCEDERSVSCLDNCIKSADDKKDCDCIDCVAGVFIFDGVAKLLVCFGILP